MNRPESLTTLGWLARLELDFHVAPVQGGALPISGALRTNLKHQHLGPLRIQKALYPEGPSLCQAIIVHPPGGIAGGDRLEVELQSQVQSQALITTPSAAKWYGTDLSVPATQKIEIDLTLFITFSESSNVILLTDKAPSKALDYANVKKIEKVLIIGEDEVMDEFERKFDLMVQHYHKLNHLTENNIDNLMLADGSKMLSTDDGSETLVHGNGGAKIKARTVNQKKLVQAVDKHDMVFAVGPAGTGKTYTADRKSVV
jgi:hypothetical protein